MENNRCPLFQRQDATLRTCQSHIYMPNSSQTQSGLSWDSRSSTVLRSEQPKCHLTRKAPRNKRLYSPPSLTMKQISSQTVQYLFNFACNRPLSIINQPLRKSQQPANREPKKAISHSLPDQNTPAKRQTQLQSHKIQSSIHSSPNQKSEINKRKTALNSKGSTNQTSQHKEKKSEK